MGADDPTITPDVADSGNIARLIRRIVDPVPAPADDLPIGQGFRLARRIAVLILLAVVAYWPAMQLTQSRAQGAAGMVHAASPDPDAWATLLLPQSLPWRSASPSPALEIAMHIEGWINASPTAHRVFALALHALSAALLWLILRRLGVPAAWFAAAIFAVHPGGVAAVARLDQHGRVWAAALAMLSVWLTLRWYEVWPEAAQTAMASAQPADADWEQEHLHTRSSSWRRLFSTTSYVIATLAGLCAILCQPSLGLALGPVIVLILIWKRHLTRANAWVRLALLSPLLLLGVDTVWAGLHDSVLAIPGPSTAWPSTIHYTFLHLIWLAGWTLRWSVLPFPGSGPVSAAPPAIPAAVWLAGASAWLGAMAVLATFWSRRGGICAGLAIGACSFLLLLPTVFALPAIHAASNDLSVGGDGETTLIIIPIAALAAAALATLARRPPLRFQWPSIQLIGSAAAITVLGVIAFARADVLLGPEHLLRAALAADPHSPSARARLAEFLVDQGHVEEAARTLGPMQLDQCTDADAATAEGDVLRADGRPGAAIVWLQRAQSLAPDTASLFLKIAAVQLQLGQPDDAINTYEKGIRAHPADADLRNEFGLLLASRNELDQAATQFHAAIAADASAVSPHINLATILLRQGRIDDAVDQYKEALRLDPENAEAYHNIGIVLAQLRQYDNAIRLLTAAVVLRPDWPEAHNDLGVALSSDGRYQQAAFQFQRALSLRPEYTVARDNLKANENRESKAAASQPVGPG